MAAHSSTSYTPLANNDDNTSHQALVTENRPLRVDSEPISPLEAPSPPNPAGAAPIQPSVHRTNTQLTDRSDVFEATRRHSSSVSIFTQRLYGSIDPSLHSLIEKDAPTSATAREYRHSKQRRRLLRLTIGEWFNSLILCIAYFGILWAYAHKPKIDVRQRRVFNSLTTANSLLLGVNLAASLRSYAKLLRWRMLANCHRPLETFDLIMGCDSLINVVKLLYKDKNERHKWLPSKTQLLAALWLLIHLAITVLVGIIGLNYNLETSSEYILLTKGTISIVDLESLSTGNYPMDLGVIQTWGVRGAVATALDPSAETEYTQSYYSGGTGYTWYYFQDLNANDSAQGHITTRYIESQAFCEGYRVTEGQYGNTSYIIYNDGSKEVNQTLPTEPGPGGLLAMSRLNSTSSNCGPRCVDINVFQAGSLPSAQLEEDESYNLYEGRFFLCNNTVPPIGDDVDPVGTEYTISDLVARMLAGAVGWSSDPATEDGKFLYASYTNSSQVGFYVTPEESDMQRLISSFTMGAIAYMDDTSSMYRKYVASEDNPIAAQFLHVTWRYAGSILAVIPFIHLWTLVAVIFWANRAIIKDDSHLAIAKVYHSLLGSLGDKGCLLQGDEIVRVLDNPKVKYGYSTSQTQQGHLHVDILEEHGAIRCTDGPFPEGWYNGTDEKGRGDDTVMQARPRNCYRDIDAADYF